MNQQQELLVSERLTSGQNPKQVIVGNSIFVHGSNTHSPVGIQGGGREGEGHLITAENLGNICR